MSGWRHKQHPSPGEIQVIFKHHGRLTHECSHVQARLSRFQGANAISSADFYDNGEGGGSGPARAGSDFDITAGDLVNRLSMQVTYCSNAVPDELDRDMTCDDILFPACACSQLDAVVLMLLVSRLQC